MICGAVVFMRLSWNEMRRRAAKFSAKWKDASYEKGEAHSFYDGFFEIFGLDRHQVARFEEHVKKLGEGYGYIDLFWPGVLIAEHKSKGKNLDKAAEQAGEYYDALPNEEKPRYQLVCDFQEFRLLDRSNRNPIPPVALADLPQKLEIFKFMLGEETESYEELETVNIKASELMGAIHESLKKSGYEGEELEIFLTRLTFCMFADSTGIFEDHCFKKLVKRAIDNNMDMGGWISLIFQTLNKPKKGRTKTLDEDIAKLDHINGGLFEDTIEIPSFDTPMCNRLREATEFDWSEISPEIFGSLFQSVMGKKKRREKGAHYTSERDILKVINPLFMDNLWRKFKTIKSSKSKLQKFQDELAGLKFFDPACGCGNFLVVAYRELRRLEIEVLLIIHADKRQKILYTRNLSKIDVHQFYGLELDEFAVHIARSALWMMDHFMNIELGDKFGEWLPRIPLEKSPTIKKYDALDKDWAEFLAPEECSFIFGNPPFSGQSYQSKKQREQMRILTKPEGKNATPLDYVCAWFLKSAAYVRQADHNIPFAFVATNSITQGEQVAMLWEPLLHEYKLEIIFAHQSFVWESEASGKAQVHVVIVGLEKQEDARKDKMLFSYEKPKGSPVGESVGAISPYLFDASQLKNSKLIINNSNKPISPRPIMKRGVQPTDGGHYIFRSSDITTFTDKEPKAKKFMRPFIGSKELLYDKRRSILYLEHATPNELEKMPLVEDLIKLVEASRKASKKPATKKSALYPTLLEGRKIPTKPFLAIPQTSSEKREYIPVRFYEPPTIPSVKAYFIESATPADLALLSSAMHMAWVRTVTGRIKSDYSYSIGVVYNTFPLPLDKDLSKLAPFGQAILDARAKHPDTTLATHYKLPIDSNLRRAHEANDRAVDRLYSPKPFADDTARINHLFALYEKQTAQ